jgi:two-component system NtrC family sensor kinase
VTGEGDVDETTKSSPADQELLERAKVAVEADRALTERPSISIRLRIGLSLAASFLVFAAMAGVSLVFITRIGLSLRLLEDVNTYALELDQTRRYEKNYLLYGTDLPDALSQVQTALNLLQSTRENMGRLVGEATYARIERNLVAYEQALEQLAALAKGGEEVPPQQRAETEHELRKRGAQALLDAKALIDQEGRRIDKRISHSQLMITGSLILLAIVLAYVANFLTRQIAGPLGRFVNYTKRIAGGDFSPIKPVRKFKDEFSELGVAVNRMLTELQNRQEQLDRTARMAAVGTLTAGIAHELNNPLNNISLNTEALLDTFDDYSREEKMRMLEDTFAQVQRASGTVHSLLDFTRVEEPVLIPLAVAKVVEGGKTLVANEARLADVEFDVDLPADLPRVRGNPRGLEQVFLNLFLNAIQAMPDGGTISVHARPVDGGLVQIDVSDTGVGIPEAVLPSIFDPFFTNKEVGVGTGLGLTVSHGILEKHGGRIEVRSQVGAGTTFSVYLARSETGGETDSGSDGESERTT